MTDVMVFVK
jgi:hypothetical protein